MAAKIIIIITLVVSLVPICYSKAFSNFTRNLEIGLTNYFIDYKHNPNIDSEKYLPREITDHFDDIKWFLSGGHDTKFQSLSHEAQVSSCDACILGVDAIYGTWLGGIELGDLLDAGVKICKSSMDERVCSGMVNHFKSILLHIFKNDKNFRGAKFCSLLLGGKCGDWEALYNFDLDFSGREGDVKPEFQKPKQTGTKVSKILHLSDIHLLLSYKEGTDTDCGLPTCCMNFTNMATDPNNAAGKWGSFSCDLPTWTFRNILEHIKETHFEDISYIMLTGDYSGHDIWLQTHQEILDTAQTTVNLIKEYFPDTPVIPSLGNHDSYPVNWLPSSSITNKSLSIDWLYSNMWKIYGNWMPEEAKDTFLKDGYFTFLKEPGFRIIVVNSNSYHGPNFYLNLGYEDPYGMFQWLYDALLEAEKNNEKVHIVSHVPPGDSMAVSGAGKNYARIVDRFANTIAAQFYGHTHHDQFVLYYDYDTNTKPINVGYVVPSVTAYYGLNPSYRIYHVDGFDPDSSKHVIDHETYIMDLKATNRNSDKEPQYYKLYQATKDLGMASLFPDDYQDLLHRIANDKDMYQKFYNFFYSASPLYSSSIRFSKKDLLCMMLSTSFVDTRKCEEIMS